MSDPSLYINLIFIAQKLLKKNIKSQFFIETTLK